MSLMAFLLHCTLHTSIVLFQCHVAKCLAFWGAIAPLPPPPQSALDWQEKITYYLRVVHRVHAGGCCRHHFELTRVLFAIVYNDV